MLSIKNEEISWGYAGRLAIRRGDILRFEIPKGLHLGGLSGRCKVEKFERVPQIKGPGIPLFVAGDLLIYILIESRTEPGTYSISMRFAPGGVRFSPLESQDLQLYTGG